MLFGSQTDIRAKYNTGSDNFPKGDPNKSGSNFWKGIAKNWDTFRSNLCWQIGNGETTRFWEDCWVFHDDTLISSLIQPLNGNLCQRRVSDMINGQGMWDQAVLRGVLPENVVAKILMLPPPRILDSEDSLSWENTANGLFTTNSAYLAVKQCPASPASGKIDLVWKWPGPERVRLFLWKAYHDILLTNFERARRHISDEHLCLVCGGFEESLLHTFRDCNRLKLL